MFRIGSASRPTAKDIFDRVMFFLPSPELATAILKQNQRLIAESVQGSFTAVYENVAGESEAEDGSLLGRMESSVLPARSPSDPDNQLIATRRMIAERLYNYLSSLSETPRAMKGTGFPLWEYLPKGAATVLGLSSDNPAKARVARDLTESLTREFREWLLTEHYGQFLAPEISIRLEGDDILQLRFLTEEEEGPVGQLIHEARPSSQPRGGEYREASAAQSISAVAQSAEVEPADNAVAVRDQTAASSS